MRIKPSMRACERTMIIAVLVAGCASGAPRGWDVDTDTLQDTLATKILEQTGVAVRVDCPDSVPLLRGDIFECTATAGDGSTSPVGVVQNDDQGNVSWELKP